jgi:hypothetical protein
MGGLAGVTESSRSLSAASATGRRRRGRTLELRVGFRPAASGELGGDAGGEEHQTDGEGAEDPSQLHAALKHEPVEQGQDQDKNRCLGEERGAAMRGDCEEIAECGGFLFSQSCIPIMSLAITSIRILEIPKTPIGISSEPTTTKSKTRASRKSTGSSDYRNGLRKCSGSSVVIGGQTRINIGSCNDSRYGKEVIRSFKHAGLEKFYKPVQRRASTPPTRIS